MSDLGSEIQTEIDDIKALQTASETPDGQLGDDWDTEYEAFAEGVQRALDAAASQSGFDSHAADAAAHHTKTVDTQLDPGHTNPTYDADEDGVIDADVNNANTASDVTTTGELYGTEEGINLANPLHRVYSDSAYFHTYFESIDTWHRATSGSGSVIASQFHIKLRTGATSGSSASLYKTVNNDINRNFATVDSERVFRIEASFRNGADSRTTYITNGGLQNNEAGFGIKAANGDILGVLHDGTSESTVTLATPPTGEHYKADLMCRYDPTGTVEFFIDKAKQGELSHSLGNFDGRKINFYTDNTSAVERELWFSEFRMGIAP